MHPSLILVSASTPVLALAMWSALPGQADSRVFDVAQLPPILEEVSEAEQQPEQYWIQAESRVKLSDLARLLNIPVKTLASVNESGLGKVFEKGDWIRFEGVSTELTFELTALDRSSYQTSAPLTPPPPLSETARVQRGDSLASFMKRHGVSSDQLKQYNPGVDLAKLTIGREVRIAKAVGGQKLLAIRPTVSGGASYPNRPVFPVKENRQESLSSTYMWPTKGVFTSGYGWRWGRMHKGIDIANNTGTSIHAARDGIVTYSGWSSGYGYLVEITHPDGESSRYAHNSRLLVKKGQMIPQGARISLMGSTGRSTGPHLHFEIRQSGGAAMNPLTRLPARKA